MFNPFTDEYFNNAKKVAEVCGINPIVKYRVFGRFNGLAALAPARYLIETLSPNVKVTTLPVATPFFYGDTIMTLEGEFQDIVNLETQYLQWCMLPCYCALQAKKIVDIANGKDVLDFAARHLFGAESVALASYGAEIGGITKFSTAVGANSIAYLQQCIREYKRVMALHRNILMFTKDAIGTIPHSLIAIFKGDYIKVADAYSKAFPDEKQIHLIDYNNQEIDDSLILVKHLGKKLHGVRIDTPGECPAQLDLSGSHKSVRREDMAKGVTKTAVTRLRYYLDKNGGSHVKIFVSSGFDVSKTSMFMDWNNGCPNDFDAIGTGSYIPDWPNCCADICEVDGKRETKHGRWWGYESNKKFYEILERCGNL